MIVPLGTNQVRSLLLTNEIGYDTDRFGGRAPHGIEPRNKYSMYLLTVSVGKGIYASIFITHTPEPDEEIDFMAQSNLILTSKSKSVEVFFHSALPRRDDDLFASTYSPHALSIGALREDVFINEEGEVMSEVSNKLGGRAYIIDQKFHTEINDEILRRGFYHFLQLDGSALSSPGVKVTGKYSLGFGILHLYLKPTKGHYDWCCFYETG